MKIIDMHCHVGISTDGGGVTFDELRALLDEYPVERAVVFPIDEADKAPTYERPNERLAGYAARDPRIIPFGRIDPHAGDAALAEMDRFPQLGLRGLKLHPYSEKFGPELAAPAFGKARELRLPVMLHSSQLTFGPGEIEGWKKVFSLTDTPVIAAHGGKDNYRRLAKILPGIPNLYTDTTVVSFFRTKYLYEAVGADRLVYGCDTPYSHPALERAKYALILKPEDRDKVFHENARKILGL